MEHSVAELFVILALNPEKGRVSLNDIPFKYSLTGALIMDYHDRGEIRIENKLVVPSFRKNSDIIHDLFAEKIMKSDKNRRISFWIRRLTNNSRLIFREIVSSLEKKKIVRREHKKFLNIFSYHKYWLTDNSVRSRIIEDLRRILLYRKEPGKKEIMLLGLVEASRAYSLLSRERGESRVLRKANSEFLKGNIKSSEIIQAIIEVQAAIVASITAATVAAHGSH